MNSFVENYHIENSKIIMIGNGCSPLHIVEKQLTRNLRKRIISPLGLGPNDFFLLQTDSVPPSEAISKQYATWLIEHIQSWDSLRLSEIPSNDLCWKRFVEELRSLGMNVEVDRSRSYYFIDVSGDWKEYFEKLRIRDLRTRYNRVKRNNLSFKVLIVKHGIQKYIDDLLVHYDQRRREVKQPNAFNNINHRRMLIDIIPKYEKMGWIMLSILQGSDGENWAYQLDFIKDGVQYHYAPTFDMKYSEFSPSKILLLETIKNAFSDPDIREFNFMRGEASYKSQFATQKSPYISIVVENIHSRRNRLIKLYNQLSRGYLLIRSLFYNVWNSRTGN